MTPQLRWTSAAPVPVWTILNIPGRESVKMIQNMKGKTRMWMRGKEDVDVEEKEVEREETTQIEGTGKIGILWFPSREYYS